jgi:thymidine phosphorylase
VSEGQPLLTLHTDEPERFARAMESLEGSFEIQQSEIRRGDSTSPSSFSALVIDRIGA